MGDETVIRPHAAAPAQGGEACLVFVEGPPALLGHRVALAEELVLGRDAACGVRLEAEDVSRRHARISPHGDGHVVGDLGSLNGTWVNGLEVEVRRLCTGDRIRVGPFVARYLAAGDAEAAYHETLARRASTDELTGLANRGAFEAALERALAAARRDGRPLALALVDVDHFKAVNDAHGHPAGDAVLRAVAARLRDAVRDGDLVARVGGEEFAALLPGAGPAAAVEVAERIAARVRGAPAAVAAAVGAVAVTVSCGVATLQHDDDELSLVSRADARLYDAKHAGRDRVRA